jgi:hypothetical protein
MRFDKVNRPTGFIKPGDAGNCRLRQILPGRSRLINHRGRTVRLRFVVPAAYPGDMPRAGIGRHLSLDTAMRIYGPNGTTFGSPSSGTRKTGSSSFSLPDTPTASETRPTLAPPAANSLDALLAMQSVEDPTERRKRSVKRGRGALDVLDELKISLLTGSINPAMLTRLRSAAAELKESSGDHGLDAVLSEIELRVEVELAKAGQV